MPMSPPDITRCLEEAIPGAEIRLTDLAGDNDHFQVEVVSAAFRGKSRILQHRMVYDALQGKMGGVLHALAVKTSVPAE